MMKIRQVNDLIDRAGVFYVKNNTELSWPIRSGADYNEN